MKKTSSRKTRPAPHRHAGSTDTGTLIAELSALCGPPGREDAVRQRIAREISDHFHRTETSPLGALHAIAGTENQPRWMLTAHMDEVGVIVSHVESAGYARFALLGNKQAASLVGHLVRFSGGRIAIIRSGSVDGTAALTSDDLRLDFGAAEGDRPGIAVGDVGCLDSGGQRLGDRFVAANAGGRACIAALARAALSIEQPPTELQFVFSVQGAFGGDAGLTSAATLAPHAAWVVCPAPADDKPHTTENPIRLGGGPIIAVRHGATASDPHLVQVLASLAKKTKISYQLGVFTQELPGSGLPAAGAGVLTAWLCIPCRGLDTSAEMVDLADVDRTIRLLVALCKSQPEWI